MLIGIDYSEVGKRIRTARKERNMTQEELSVVCGCSGNHLSAIETGKHKPSLELIVTIATVLECSIDSLLLDYNVKCSDYAIQMHIVPKLKSCSYHDLKYIEKFIDDTIEYRNGLIAPAKL